MQRLKEYAQSKGCKMTTYSSIYRQADKRKLNVKADMFVNELIGLSEKYNGFIYRYNDLCLIAYDDTMNDTSQELTALHELGHLLTVFSVVICSTLALISANLSFFKFTHPSSFSCLEILCCDTLYLSAKSLYDILVLIYSFFTFNQSIFALEHWDSKDSVKRMKQTVGEMQIGEFMADMFACVVTALKMYKECY